MKNTLVKKLLSTIALGALVFNLGACAQKPAQTPASSDAVTSQDSATASDAQANADGKVVLKGIVDLVPHSEIIEHVKPILAEQGI